MLKTLRMDFKEIFKNIVHVKFYLFTLYIHKFSLKSESLN